MKVQASSRPRVPRVPGVPDGAGTPPRAAGPACSTIDVARRLGLAVRSVQLMVDRGELQAWKTPGGHRRIARDAVDRWLAQQHGRQGQHAVPVPVPVPVRLSAAPTATLAPRVLLIEDSRHFQNLVTLLLRQHFPHVDLHVADDGIAGLGMAGQLQPDVLLVDILLPGIDGGALITSLRLHPAFGRSRLIVITSLDSAGLEPYRFALGGVPVVHKPMLVTELPALLAQALAASAAQAAAAPA